METSNITKNELDRKFTLTHNTQLRINLPDFILADAAALFDRIAARPIHLVPTSHYRWVQPICRATNPAGVNHPIL
jgi:hypothetical protein